jgi:hypothetical protein
MFAVLVLLILALSHATTLSAEMILPPSSFLAMYDSGDSAFITISSPPARIYLFENIVFIGSRLPAVLGPKSLSIWFLFKLIIYRTRYEIPQKPKTPSPVPFLTLILIVLSLYVLSKKLIL